MINRFIYSFLLLAGLASAFAGCTSDPEVDDPAQIGGDGSPSWVTIDFGEKSFDEVNIKTRATLDGVAESRVMNLFVFIFGPKETDENGNVDAQRLYGRFFDHTNRVDSKFELDDATKEECWWVADNATEAMAHGRLHILAPAIQGATLYVLANVNADMVNISPDKLRFVEKLSDLKNMTATLNQEITERNGFFPMAGLAGDQEGNIAIGSNKITCNGSENFEVMLKRLDAKVEVKLRVAKGYRGDKTDKNPETGIAITTAHEIESFVPLSWQVVNLPRTAFILEHSEGDAKTVMFNTKETNFETRETDYVSYSYIDNDPTTEESGVVTKKNVETEAHGFSFYMLENRIKPEKNVYLDGTKKPTIEGVDARSYHLRDKRRKHTDETSDDYGKYDTTNGLWEYAPEEGTYLVIKGEVVMAVDISDEGKQQQLSADVVYYIHLGDFGGQDTNGDGILDEYGDINNYDILRNTSYTYTITIYGVDNIQVEVETKETGTVENESGATGHVYVAKEKIFTFDSHYGSAVVSFDEGHLTDVKHLLWYVRTPFGREGKPHVIGGIEVPAGLDYQWVHFRVNELDRNGRYLTTQAEYHPDEVMNILDFSKYIKDQKLKFDKVRNGEIDGNIENVTDFRREFDEDWYNKFANGAPKEQDGEWYRYRIYVTIFVDEFYYDANPITGDKRQDLWKDFVNQPFRLMHILCDADESADEASRTTGSVVTIRQRSIQTVFNTQKPELKTAWGCETIDETRDSLWYFSKNEHYDKDGNYVQIDGVPDQAAYDTGNTTDGNGLYNTARIWGLLNGRGANAKYNTKLWRDYVDFDQPTFLVDRADRKTMRYSCMMRNRDENGNRNIDAKEVKWYLASISQLTTLYVGDQGLHSEAVLYPYYKQKITSSDIDPETNSYPWRSHIVSSTINGYWPEVLWAEEGLSTGHYYQAWRKAAPMSVRCVRNLGMDPDTEEEAQRRLADQNNTPEKAIQVSGPGIDNGEAADMNSVYRFDLTNLNPQSIRYYSSQELEPRNEHAVEARTYWAFETGILTDKSYSYDALYDMIRDGKSPCPDGYRVPNVREGALMSVRCPLSWMQTEKVNEKGETETVNLTSRVSSYYSHGLRGTDQDKGTQSTEDYPNNEWARSNSWVFSGDRTYLDTKYETAQIRCIKDIRQ